MLWGGGGPAIIGGHDPGRSGPVGNLKSLVRHPSRENKSMQEMDRVPEVPWSLCATVSKGLEAVGGCAHCGERSRRAGFISVNLDNHTVHPKISIPWPAPIF